MDRFRSAARSHTGAVRDLNEDRYVDRPDTGLWAVADGMGGHSAGDLAAQMTVDALVGLTAEGVVPAPAAVHEAIATVNATLLERSGQGRAATSGSTLVLLLADRGLYTCLWAGDSRAYVVRDGQLTPISHDHSVVQEMVDAGVLSAAQARVHPHSNVITRAIGVADALRLDAATGAIQPRDRYLLCSDGLTSALEEQEILPLLCGPDLNAAADVLMAAALRRRPRDNVTFVLVEPLG